MPNEKKQKSTSAYDELAERLFHLNAMFSDLPIDDVYNAFNDAGGYGWMVQMPEIQNRRVKSVNTRPADYTKDQIESMVINPGEHEQALRAVSASLASSTKTYDLIPQTYQDIMSYDWYIYPSYSDKNPDVSQQKKDLALAYEIARQIEPKRMGHEILGKCVQYGKVFYIPRVSVDKAHGKVNYAFLQQLPEDWCKIVGFNNGPGKYTVAFNLMYFMRPGNVPEQFGDLFTPYLSAFYSVVETKEKYAYSSANKKVSIDTERFQQLDIARTAGSPEWQRIGRTWFYWVTLPADAVITFEVCDRNDYVAPPTTGLMVSMTQIPNYESLQLELIMNPLTSVLTGTLDTYDTKGVPNADPIAVSPPTRKLFEALWYEMLQRNNTSGIGLYLAPARDLKLQTISDSVSNTNISTSAYSDQIQKAGLSALIPSTNDPKVGIATLSAKISAQYGKIVYRRFERMFDWMFERIGFRTKLRFCMFGDIFSHDTDLENARKGMSIGVLTDTLRYEAMTGFNILDDMCVSDFVEGTGILKKRIPINQYSVQNAQSGSDSKDDTIPSEIKKEISDDGRPSEDGSISSQVTEKTDS